MRYTVADTVAQLGLFVSLAISVPNSWEVDRRAALLAGLMLAGSLSAHAWLGWDGWQRRRTGRSRPEGATTHLPWHVDLALLAVVAGTTWWASTPNGVTGREWASVGLIGSLSVIIVSVEVRRRLTARRTAS